MNKLMMSEPEVNRLKRLLQVVHGDGWNEFTIKQKMDIVREITHIVESSELPSDIKELSSNLMLWLNEAAGVVVYH